MTLAQLRRILERFEQDNYGACEVVYLANGKEQTFDMIIAVAPQNPALASPVILLADGDSVDVSAEPPPARAG